MPRNDTATTDVQQARIDEIQDEHQRPRLYAQQVQGKTIIGQFRRYVTREDADCIEHALYEFLMMVCGFIAEYGLIPPGGGFRVKWAEPAALIEELDNSDGAARRGRVCRVYSDGMTDVEVFAAIDKLADAHRASCQAGREKRRFSTDVSIALKILEPHGFIVVPAGWQLTADTSAPETEQPQGSLAEALTRLAARNGMRLIAPPTVEAGGQIRLL
jgi:hypothetical protein